MGKICLQNEFIQRLNTFIYPGYKLSQYEELNLTDKIAKWLYQNHGAINKY
jgi:hypothetical protein